MGGSRSATADDVYVGGNISYETSGDDTLGLIATSDLIITELRALHDDVAGRDAGADRAVEDERHAAAARAA